MNIKDICIQMEKTKNKDELYLISNLSDDAGLFSSDGKLFFIEKEFSEHHAEEIDTEYLKLNIHVRIKSVANHQSFEDGYYNLIMYKSEDINNLEVFVNLCEIYATNDENLLFKDFFYSLISLFQLPAEQSFKNAVGLYGELAVLINAYETYNTDISNYWHNEGTNSKYDYSNGEEAIEVKTTSFENGSVLVKHEQIFDEKNCFLATVMCEENELGETVKELVDRVLSYVNAFNGISFSINLEKEIKKISEQDFKNSKFMTKQINYYDTKKINPFGIIPDNINELKYRMEIDEKEKMDEVEIVKLFKQFSK